MSDHPRRIASALQYSVVDNTPRVIARGKGQLAEKIIALAADAGIDIVQDDRLAERLLLLDIEQEIPEQLYQVVAEIFRIILRR